MRRYSEAVKADVRRRMHPPHRQSVARISEELGIHVMTLYKTWRPPSLGGAGGICASDALTERLQRWEGAQREEQSFRSAWQGPEPHRRIEAV